LTYEGYGPGGVAMLVEVVTDNKNRTVAEVRHIFSRGGGNLGETGSVAWMFERKGVITIPKQGKTEDQILEIVLDEGAEDIQTEEEFFEVQTSIEAFEPIRKKLIDKGLTIENAALHWIAKNTISVSGETAETMIKLIEGLEDSDDVQNVFTNADFDVESLK
jgi:YebC/PmpR family DNA-binding regulatory protein